MFIAPTLLRKTVVAGRLGKKTGQGFIHDRIVDDLYPDSVTDELKGIVARIAAGPWRGTPD